MGRPSKFDGSFFVRVTKKELDVMPHPEAWLEEMIREAGHDPDTCKVDVKESKITAHVLFKVTPNVVEK